MSRKHRFTGAVLLAALLTLSGCQNCGNAFAPSAVGRVSGGCNPHPVEGYETDSTCVAVSAQILADPALSCKTHCICPPGTVRKCTVRRDIPGSTAFVPPVMGLIIAGEVARHLAEGSI